VASGETRFHVRTRTLRRRRGVASFSAPEPRFPRLTTGSVQVSSKTGQLQSLVHTRARPCSREGRLLESSRRTVSAGCSPAPTCPLRKPTYRHHAGLDADR
jgi:hypothetical protein